MSGTGRMPAVLPAMAGIALALVLGLGGCQAPGCASPAVLDFLDQRDHQANLSHVDLLRGAVGSTPGAQPNLARCTIWERVRDATPNGLALRRQDYAVERVQTGWRLLP